MDMKRDMEPDTGTCPHCRADISFMYFRHEWMESGKVDVNDTKDTEERDTYVFECSNCNMILQDITTIGDAQDFFMGIRKE